MIVQAVIIGESTGFKKLDGLMWIRLSSTSDAMSVETSRQSLLDIRRGMVEMTKSILERIESEKARVRNVCKWCQSTNISYIMLISQCYHIVEISFHKGEQYLCLDCGRITVKERNG